MFDKALLTIYVLSVPLLTAAEPTQTAKDPAKDIQVGFEVRLVTVTPDSFRSLHGQIGLQAGQECLGYLDYEHMRKLMAVLQADAQSHVIQTPKLTVFDKQRASLEITTKQPFVTDLKAVREKDELTVVPKTEEISTGFTMALRPVVAADRRSVIVDFKASLTDLEGQVPTVGVQTRLTGQPGEDSKRAEETVTQYVQQPHVQTMKVESSYRIADGKTAVVQLGTKVDAARAEYGPPVVSKIPYVSRLFKNVAYTRQAHITLVLITPRIIVEEEEEAKIVGEAKH